MEPIILISSKERKVALFVYVILGLTIGWLLSFFNTSIIPNPTHTGYFTDVLSVLIVVLILAHFLS